MTSPVNDLTALEQRISEVEQQNRRIARQNRWLKVAVFALPLVAVLTGAAAKQGDVEANTVTTKSLIIQDSNGRTVAALKDGGNGGYLSILDSQGRTRLAVGINDDSRPVVALVGKDGKERGSFFEWKQAGWLVLNPSGGEKPKSQVSVGVDESREPFIRIWNEAGERIVNLGSAEGT